MQVGSYKNYLINLAAHSRPAETVALLLEHGADPTLLETVQFRSPLYLAIRKGREDVVDVLLADPRVRESLTIPVGRAKETPLMAAVKKENHTIVRNLIEAGGRAVVNIQERAGASPISVAVAHNDKKMVQMLLPYSDATLLSRPLSVAVSHLSRDDAEEVEKALSVVKMLLDAGADPFVCSHVIGESTAMHSAIAVGNAECIDLFKARLTKETVDVRNRLHQTLLYAALEKGNAELADYLVVQGADVKAVESVGRNVLFAAVESGNAEVVARAIGYAGYPGPLNSSGEDGTIADLDSSIKNAVGRARSRGDADEIRRFEAMEQFLAGVHRAYVKVKELHEEKEEVKLCQGIFQEGISPEHINALGRYVEEDDAVRDDVGQCLVSLRDALGKERSRKLKMDCYQEHVGPLAQSCKTMAFLFGGGVTANPPVYQAGELTSVIPIMQIVAGFLGGEEIALSMDKKADKAQKEHQNWVDYMNFDITVGELDAIRGGDTSWISR
jgi:ankyrin repeat protein